MKWWRQFQARVQSVFQKQEPKEPIAPRLRVPPRRRREYTGRESGTRKAILVVLAHGEWRTRAEIATCLDVSTAGIHLPLMVKDGVLEERWVLRRKQYRLTVQPQAVVAVDPHGGSSNA